MSIINASIPLSGGSIYFVYDITGSCQSKTVSSWRVSGSTTDVEWFDTTISTATTSIEVSANGNDGQDRYIKIIPTIDNSECLDSLIFVSQTKNPCSCFDFDGIMPIVISASGLTEPLEYGTIVKKDSSCSWDDLKFETDCTLVQGNIIISGGNDDVKNVYITSYPENTNDAARMCLVDAVYKNQTLCYEMGIMQEGREETCDCNNINYSLKVLKSTLPQAGTDGQEIIIASGVTACGYLEPVVSADTTFLGGGMTVETAATIDGKISFVWKGVILRTDLPSVPIGVQFNLLDREGRQIKGCPTFTSLTQLGNYCRCYDYHTVQITDNRGLYFADGICYILLTSETKRAPIDLNVRVGGTYSCSSAVLFKTDHPEYFGEVAPKFNKWHPFTGFYNHFDFYFSDYLDNVNPGDSFTITAQTATDVILNEKGEIQTLYPCGLEEILNFQFSGCSCDFYNFDEYQSISINPGETYHFTMSEYLVESCKESLSIDIINSDDNPTNLIINRIDDTRYDVTIPDDTEPGVYFVYVLTTLDGTYCGTMYTQSFQVNDVSCSDCSKDFLEILYTQTSYTIQCYNERIEFQTKPYSYYKDCGHVKLQIMNDSNRFRIIENGNYGDEIRYTNNEGIIPSTGDSVTLKAWIVDDNEMPVFGDDCFKVWTYTIDCACDCGSEKLQFTASTDIKDSYAPGDDVLIGHYNPPTSSCLTFVAISANVGLASISTENGQVIIHIFEEVDTEAYYEIQIYLMNQYNQICGNAVRFGINIIPN